jgi:hypothetical protein
MLALANRPKHDRGGARVSVSTGRWRLDGNAIGAALIHCAVEYSLVVSLEKLSQARFVREFLVLCRFGLGFVGIRNRMAKWILTGIDEEFARSDPEYEDLLED